MATLPLVDTDPEAECFLIERLGREPLWRRAEQLFALIRSRNDLILADLRRRHPAADDAELRVRLAARLLPREDVIKIFNWDPEVRGY